MKNVLEGENLWVLLLPGSTVYNCEFVVTGSQALCLYVCLAALKTKTDPHILYVTLLARGEVFLYLPTLHVPA